VRQLVTPAHACAQVLAAIADVDTSDLVALTIRNLTGAGEGVIVGDRRMAIPRLLAAPSARRLSAGIRRWFIGACRIKHHFARKSSRHQLASSGLAACTSMAVIACGQ